MNSARPALPTPIEVRHVALTLISIAAVIGLLQFMQAILIPFVLGGLLFYALDPAVDWLQRKHVPRTIGAALMLLFVVAGVAVLVYSLQRQALTVFDQLPAGARRLAQSLERRQSTPGPIEQVQQAADELQKTSDVPAEADPGVVRVQVEEPAFQASQYVWAGWTSALSGLNQAVMILFLTYFMLLSDQLFKRKLVEVVGPTLSKKKITVQILEDVAGQIEQFLIIQILTSAVVAVVTWGALWTLGLHQAALWGVVAGIFNSIPYYGPLLVTGLLALVAFLQFGTFGMTAAVAGVSLLITTLEGMILTPRLVGRAAQMNTVAVFAGLLFWSWVWGVWGIFLAVPMMMVFKAICDRVESFEPIGRLLGE